MDLVADPRLPEGMLTIAGPDSAHRGLRRYSFLIDSGADCNLVDPAMACELLTMVTLPTVGITGITGNKLHTRGAGTLDLAFFLDGRLRTRPMATAHVRRSRVWFTPGGQSDTRSAARATSSSWEVPALPEVPAT